MSSESGPQAPADIGRDARVTMGARCACATSHRRMARVGSCPPWAVRRGDTSITARHAHAWFGGMVKVRYGLAVASLVPLLTLGGGAAQYAAEAVPAAQSHPVTLRGSMSVGSGTPSAVASTSSLARCKAHYATTAAWIDCTGGSQKSWVRLGYNCRVLGKTRTHHTSWYRVDPGRKKTVSRECTFKATRAWANVREY